MQLELGFAPALRSRGVSCERCAHRATRNHVSRLACGSQRVRQIFADDARAPGGDCGPEGRRFLDERTLP